MALVDIKALQAEAEKEVADGIAKDAKAKLVAKLKQIAAAERVVANLKLEYQQILLDIGNA